MKNRTSGFTLVELMVVVLLVGLVVLLFTQIPLFGLSSWRKGSERLKMQRDAHYAMIKIQHELRPAEDSSVSPKAGEDETDKLIIDGVSYYVDKTGTSESNEFFYDLVQESVEKELIVNGDYDTDFKVVREGSAVNMTFKLVRGNVDIILTTAVKPRN